MKLFKYEIEGKSCKNQFTLIPLLRWLIIIFGILQSGLLWSAPMPATLGPPHFMEADRYFATITGNTPDEVFNIWWEKYSNYWSVQPYGWRSCSYTLTPVQLQNKVVRIDLAGDCQGTGYIRATYSCPSGYLLTPENTCVCSESDAFISKSGQCLSPTQAPNNGDPGCNGESNPINFTNGNKFQEEEDYAGSNRDMALNIKRYYNSNSTHVGLFGPHWHSAFDAGLYFNEDLMRVIVVIDDGKGEVFNFYGNTWM